MEYVLVTGAAGFIGASLCKRLLESKINVIGLDSLNNYYDRKLKFDRLKDIDCKHKADECDWRFFNICLEEEEHLKKIFDLYSPKIVVNLAAQAGVRYSLTNPQEYIKSNLVGFANILEACRNYNVENFIYASSSSVYGGNESFPFKESDNVDHPISLYAATKKSNEVIAHSYSHLYKIPMIGLRFFTVYGPWGRPDMAPMIFAKAILSRKPISIFNKGKMSRDFTYIDDIVEGVYKCCFKPAFSDLNFDPANPDPSSSFAPHRIFNIGNNKPVKLLEFVDILESKLGVKAIRNFENMQPGDVISTYADIKKINEWIDFEPKISIDIGLEKFAKWYLEYYKNQY
tara:strand:+ start:1479 stop:2510 length:1032 start_codon:yes stop_codon:yes gene_type:complete